MNKTLLWTAGAFVGCLVAAPVAAQDLGDWWENETFSARLQLGGFSPAGELDGTNLVDFKNGWNFGGGVGWQITPRVAVRANLVYATAEARDFRSPAQLGIRPSLARVDFGRFFWDADVQLRYPMRSGFAPYVLGGLGLVRVSPGDDLLLDPNGDLARLDGFTKLAGKLGMGVSYRFANSPVSVYVQGTGWIYNWSRYGLDDTRLDVTWSGGIGYRFGG